MKLKITLPTSPAEDDVFPWLYTCGYATGITNAWFFSSRHTAGRCIWAAGGAPGVMTKFLSNEDRFTRLTREEIKGIGLEALIPPAPAPIPAPGLLEAARPFYFTSADAGKVGDHVYYVGEDKIVHDIGRIDDQTPDLNDGKTLNRSWYGSVLPPGTKIEIEV